MSQYLIFLCAGPDSHLFWEKAGISFLFAVLVICRLSCKNIASGQRILTKGSIACCTIIEYGMINFAACRY